MCTVTANDEFAVIQLARNGVLGPPHMKRRFVTFAAEWAVYCKQASAPRANAELASVGRIEDMAEQQIVDQATVDQVLHDRVSGFGEWMKYAVRQTGELMGVHGIEVDRLWSLRRRAWCRR